MLLYDSGFGGGVHGKMGCKRRTVGNAVQADASCVLWSQVWVLPVILQSI